MTRQIIICCAVFTALGLASFQQKPALSEEEIVEQGVAIKVEDFRARQLRICKDRALDMAIARVDSLIRARAREEAVTPIQKPPKPQKPAFPEVRVLPDSVRLDSLRRQRQ
ncbi:MAG: hypothetical protein R3301_02425 [Saprospiraceae bacterium]|nr:hypothetical protein [Saprospiraceae bacterium]